MTTGDQNQQESIEKTLDPAGPKEPYIKPAFRFERVFETSALSCGKVHATQSGCMRNRKVS
jgi:hypothetical protein